MLHITTNIFCAQLIKSIQRWSATLVNIPTHPKKLWNYPTGFFYNFWMDWWIKFSPCDNLPHILKFMYPITDRWSSCYAQSLTGWRTKWNISQLMSHTYFPQELSECKSEIKRKLIVDFTGFIR